MLWVGNALSTGEMFWSWARHWKLACSLKNNKLCITSSRLSKNNNKNYEACAKHLANWIRLHYRDTHDILTSWVNTNNLFFSTVLLFYFDFNKLCGLSFFGNVDALPNPSKEQLLEIVQRHFMTQVTFLFFEQLKSKAKSSLWMCLLSSL